MVEKIGSSSRSPAPICRLATMTPEKALMRHPTSLRPRDTSKGVGDLTKSEEGFCLAIEKRQLSMSVDYNLSNESKFVSGTTLLIRQSITRDKLVAIDSRESSDTMNIFRDNRLKCILGTSAEHLLVSTGEVGLSDLIKREVRWLLWDSEVTLSLPALWDIIELSIQRRLEHDRLNTREPMSRICTVSVVSRYGDPFLCIVLKKRVDQEFFELYGEWLLDLSAGSGSDQLEDELVEEWTPSWTITNVLLMRTWMHKAAERDPHTGGYCMIFRGGPSKPWSCVDLTRFPAYLGNL